VGHKLSLLGHLDIAHALSHGTRQEVHAHVRDVIKKAAAGGGLILGPCNSHADIKVDNIRYMMEAVKEFGTYPIRV
jgi:uroporphyrinogen decarboxylase